MNKFYKEFHIPTDFVYTGKMMFGTIDLIKKNHFPPGSRIICLHTGGLQGNLSLPNNSLVF
jgi:1-aminocyclopropane-1-carboxylate deaminase/D-cysteine desulfhydrase-like pyridoxal-dependent ACC family enzyme